MYKKIVNEKDKLRLLRTYSHNIKISSLEEFAKKSGYGDEFIVIRFKEYLEDDPFSYRQELKDIKDDQVILQADYPATISDDKNAKEVAYLNFDEFYAYLAKVVKERIKKSPEEKAEYKQLLSEVKTALNL